MHRRQRLRLRLRDGGDPGGGPCDRRGEQACLRAGEGPGHHRDDAAPATEGRRRTQTAPQRTPGAYLAQWRANRTENKPLLRLVLANPGADYAQQGKVVDRLAAMADSPRDNLRAVTGFNLSLDNTKLAIDRLTNKLHIPVLASRVSADEIANADNSDGDLKYPGLARIIPTNRKQAAALANFHGGLRDAETVLVKDLRPNDIYDESLAKRSAGRNPARPARRTSRSPRPASTTRATPETTSRRSGRTSVNPTRKWSISRDARSICGCSP